jgi:tetrahydromethanopterin S-methyltransferase subunit B
MAVFGVVIGLFVLAILSIWLFPNSKVSDNEHDVKH